MYKEDLALNNLQGLICHKTQPNQTIKWLMNIINKVISSAYQIMELLHIFRTKVPYTRLFLNALNERD